MFRKTSSALLLLLSLSAPATAEIRTYTTTVHWQMSEAQSLEDAEATAMAKAKREVLERAGTYLETLTVVRNGQVSRDEVMAIAGGVLKAEIVGESRFMSGEAFGIEITARVDVDSGALEAKVAGLLKNDEALERDRLLENENRKLASRIAGLEKQVKSGGQPTPALKEELKQVGRLARAERLYQEALAMWVEADGGGFTDPQLALKLLTESLTLAERPLPYMLRGVAHKDLGHFGQAISDESQAIRLDPGLTVAYNNRGLCHKELKQYDKAVNDYEQAIKLKPAFSSPHNNLGCVYFELKQFGKAIAQYDMAVKLRPGDPVPYINRGIAHAELREYGKAAEDFGTAISLNPASPEAYNKRASLYIRFERYDLAVEDASMAIRLKPDSGHDYVIRGTAYFQMKQYALALSDFDQGIKFKTGDNYASVYTLKAISHLALKNYDKAVQDSATVVSLSPDSPDGYNLLGYAKVANGDVGGGCSDARKACDMGMCEALTYWKNAGKCK